VQTLTITQAAERLRVSEVTVRRRIKRGELRARQEPTASGFLWLVEFEEDEAVVHDNTPPSTGEVEALRQTIDVLRHELESRAREVERLHVIVAQQAHALQALPAQVVADQNTPQETPQGLRNWLRRALWGR
jgi:excisionase family DNA binding protein